VGAIAIMLLPGGRPNRQPTPAVVPSI
jgi:hypothetical protein